MGRSRVYRGQCHCGAIRISFETAIPPEEVDVRACQCSFCRKHGNNTSSDPEGKVVVEAKAAALQRYHFGLKNADFVICKECGVFLAAFLEDGGSVRATLNLNALDERALFTKPPRPMHFETESAETKTARRLAGWTPASLIVV